MNELPTMIQNGMFGSNQPISGGGYNPYSNPMMMAQGYGVVQPQLLFNIPPMQQQFNNMIPIGNFNYNTTAFAQQQPNQGFVFQPVTAYNLNPYQPRQDYYNPFPQYNQNPYYSYQGYGGFSPFLSMQKRQDMMNAQISVSKLKCKIAMAMTGTEYDDEKIDILYNPNNPANIKTPEQQDSDREWKQVQLFHHYSVNPSPIDYPEKHLANFMQLQIKNYHDAFDQHSLCEFIEEDYPRLMREFWIAENIKKNATRDLSSVYSSKEYNELLNMHRSSNPYINDLLNQSRYDNNIDDVEVGLAELFDREKRRRNLLEGKLPTYISSPEVQAQRRAFTESLMAQIYQKGVKSLEQSQSS